MSKTEEQFNAADADRRRFLTLAGKLGLLMAPVVTLTLSKPSYAAVFRSALVASLWLRWTLFSRSGRKKRVGELTMSLQNEAACGSALGLGSSRALSW
jgi:hypothetical protein